MESFPAYLQIVRKRGPQPFWTPIAPVHRLFSYILSYVYVAMRLTPLTVTMWGLLIGLAGVPLVLMSPQWGPTFWIGVALLNLGIIHDACDGEVARYRLHHGMQSTQTYRVGMFADFWAFAILFQAIVPVVLGAFAYLQGGHWGFLAGGIVAGFILLASYVVGFAQSAYWPGKRSEVVEESFTFASGGGLLGLARKVYFYIFETAMFTFHASIVLLAWSYVGGTPLWGLAYVAFVILGISAAFLVATYLSFRDFDLQD